MNKDQLSDLIKRYINLQKLALDNASAECNLAKQKAGVILEKIKTVCLTTHDRLLSISQDKTQLSFYAENPDSLSVSYHSSGQHTYTSSKSSAPPPHNASSEQSSHKAPFLSRGHLMMNVFLREVMELVYTPDKGMRPIETIKDQVRELAERTRVWVESRPSNLFQQEGPPPPVEYFLNLLNLRYQAYQHFTSTILQNSLYFNDMQGMSGNGPTPPDVE